MGTEQASNHHFRQLLDGAPAEAAAAFGEAFRELALQRSGQPDCDAARKLRSAGLELVRGLLRTRAGQLNAQQQLFLYSGAVADSVALKDARGERIELELLPKALYARLLACFGNTAACPPWLMVPANRLHALASGQLKPYDARRAGRWRNAVLTGPDAEAAQSHPVTGPADLARSFARYQELQQELATQTRSLVAVLSSENIAPVMQSLLYLGNEVRRLSQDGLAPENLRELQLTPTPAAHPSIARLQGLAVQFNEAMARLEGSQLRLLDSLSGTVRLAQAAASPAPAASPLPVLDATALPLLDSDYVSIELLISQTLLNDPRRSSLSPARVLLSEQLEKFADAPADCLMLPDLVEERFAEMSRLHINCFEQDAEGRSIIPAVFIEPGSGIVKWLDDRFVASFVQTEPARPGRELSLGSIDIAILRIFGLFLARGDIFNYRGERIADSFMAEYAGQIEQKVAVKFTGANKKLSYGTSTEEKDGASREDAVADYIDFIFCIFNGLPVPKKISQRKIGMLLKYCVFRDVWFSASLVMRLVAPSDQVLAREILLGLAQKYRVHVVDLIRHSLEADPRIASRYRNDAEQAIREVLGKLADELMREAAGGGEPGSPGQAAETVHDYFDV
jgi:hypothetical protein